MIVTKWFVLPQNSLLKQQALGVLRTGRPSILVKLYTLVMLIKHLSTWATYLIMSTIVIGFYEKIAPRYY